MHHAVAFDCIVNQSFGLHLVRAINLPEEERQQRDDDEVESAREVGELVELENGCDEEKDELDRQDRDAGDGEVIRVENVHCHCLCLPIEAYHKYRFAFSPRHCPTSLSLTISIHFTRCLLSRDIHGFPSAALAFF